MATGAGEDLVDVRSARHHPHPAARVALDPRADSVDHDLVVFDDGDGDLPVQLVCSHSKSPSRRHSTLTCPPACGAGGVTAPATTLTRDGSSEVAEVGLPGCRAVRWALETAKGCGSAMCAERLDVPAGPRSCSAHSSRPRPGDHSACTKGKVEGSFVRSGFPRIVARRTPDLVAGQQTGSALPLHPVNAVAKMCSCLFAGSVTYATCFDAVSGTDAAYRLTFWSCG